MRFAGIQRVFSTKEGKQYETIGAFWDEMAERYGRSNLRGLGYNWTDTTISYVIGLTDWVIDGADTFVELPDEGWTSVSGRTEELAEIYQGIYADGSLTYEIETFDDDGNCRIRYIRRPEESGCRMGMVYLICGKICSGKSTWARALKEEHHAVILSTDEATYDLIDNEQGEFYNIFAKRVNRYLRKKAAEICQAGADVILDWGFWTEEDRREISAFFRERGIRYQWHYIELSDESWHKNIEERNRRIERGEGGSDFYVDEGLMKKLLSMFEVPDEEAMDIIHRVER